MKIVSSGKVINSREFYEKKKKRRRIKFILLSIGILLVIALSIYLSRQEQFLIAEVVIPEESVVDKAEIASSVEELLKGFYLWIIPRSSIFVYPRDAIEQSLIAEFPRFESVGLNVDGRRLLITVDERIPFALYCLNTYRPTDSSKCFFLDEEGLIFAAAPSFSGDVYLIYTTEDPLEAPLGKRLVAIEEFGRLSKFIETLTILNIYPIAFEVGDDEYSIILPNDGRIIWSRESSLALTRSNLEAFLSDDSIQAQVNFLDRIKSLDLRTENKVFYKFRD